MLRNRNVYIEDFFGADGMMETSTLTPVTTTAPPPPPTETTVPTIPVSNTVDAPLNDVVTNVGDSQDPESIVEELQEIRDVLEDQYTRPPAIYYPPSYPSYRPYVVGVNDIITPATTENINVNTEMPEFTKSGGGFGGGSGSRATQEDLSEPTQQSSKNNIMWLVLIAIAVYVAYKYLKK